MSDLEQVCEDIVSMKVRGAAKIGRAAAQALVDLAKDYQGSSGEFYTFILDGARKLKGTRPTAVSLANALYYTLKDLDKDAGLEEGRKAVITAGEEFIENSLKAIDRIAEIGAQQIGQGEVVMTICNSQVALGVLIKAHQLGKGIEVYSAESRPRYQGRLTVKQLAESGVPVNMIVDSSVRHFMPMVDKVFVGADAITADGELFNKIGTSQVALIAKEYSKPFYVCAETYKFAPQTLKGEKIIIEERDVSEVAEQSDFPGVKIRNPAFDMTPPENISGIITENGIVKPAQAREIIIGMMGRSDLLL